MQPDEGHSPWYDWNGDWAQKREGFILSFLVPGYYPEIAEDTSMSEVEGGMYQHVADELAGTIGANAAYGQYIDPTVGASSWGIGISLEFIQVVAEAATIGAFMVQLAPYVHRAIQHLREKFVVNGKKPPLRFSKEVLQVLTVTEICTKEGVNPSSIKKVQCITHHGKFSEQRTDLRDLYSAYTILIEAQIEHKPYVVWNYLVTSSGHVVSASQVSIPMPNQTDWSTMKLPKRLLKGLD